MARVPFIATKVTSKGCKNAPISPLMLGMMSLRNFMERMRGEILKIILRAVSYLI
jgi:hypothetical protein